MSSSSSWFTKTPSKNYELPRWHASLSASIIPPPIVQSTYQSSPRLSTILPIRSVIIEKPNASETRESEIQADLQFLLDAQAEGLIRGIEGRISDGSSTGSITPTARISKYDQRDRPARKRLGLRSARKGIYSCMITLSSIKDEELQSAEFELQDGEATLNRIDEWEKKRQGLQEATSKVDDEQETIRIQRLRQESDTLQEEINKVETHLMELRTRQRRIIKQANEIENTVQAKLASYTTSLSLLENDIRAFLTSAPDAVVANGQSWKKPEQRTLDMARTQINSERNDIEKLKSSLQLERDALEEGSKMWKDVAGKVTDFERRLRLQMVGSKMSDSSNHAWDESSQPSELHEIYTHLQSLIEELEKDMQSAEDRNWRLLIAAIGAELDALKRGQQILKSMVFVNEQGSLDDGQEGDRQAEGTSHHTTRHSKARNYADDEPDPDLLFSLQDGDVDD